MGKRDQDNDIYLKFSRAVTDKYGIVYVRLDQSGNYFLIIQKLLEIFLKSKFLSRIEDRINIETEINSYSGKSLILFFTLF